MGSEGLKNRKSLEGERHEIHLKMLMEPPIRIPTFIVLENRRTRLPPFVPRQRDSNAISNLVAV